MPTHLVRTEKWNGIAAGDAVDVVGLVKRGANWTFLAHVRNERSGAEHVEVVGGVGADRSVRAFDPEQIFPVGSLRGHTRRRAVGATQLPLVQAPKLPFG